MLRSAAPAGLLHPAADPALLHPAACAATAVSALLREHAADAEHQRPRLQRERGRANARAGSGAAAGTTVYYGGGGGGGGYMPPMATGVVQLNVDVGKKMKRVAYQASRTRTRKVVIQAVCIDARSIPHPASQVTPDREIAEGYEGELYRCIAGTWLQASIAEFDGRIDFTGGRTLACRKDDALYRTRDGQVICKPQIKQRDCNERSLLRRFGAGVKILTIVETETYTAYREEEEKAEATVATSMSLDGGVGGTVY